MTIQVRAATEFKDVAAIVGPKDPASTVCFCLNYRIGTAASRKLKGSDRAQKVKELCRQTPAPGVIAYLDNEPVGWAAVHPRAGTSFARSRVIPHVDDADAWSLWCFRVRPGFRKRGIMHSLISGAVTHAADQGASAIEGYPVDNAGKPVNSTMAYVGTCALFEAAGFARAADTDSVIDGFSRVVMRRDLR